MKVLVDATMLDGGPSGGATRLAALGAALARRGNVETLHLVRPGVDPLPGLVTVPFAGTTSPLGRALAGRRLAALARKEGASLFAAGALPLPSVRGLSQVLTLHDLRFLDPASGSSPWRRWWGLRRLPANLKRAVCVIAVSQSTAQVLHARGLMEPARTAVVPNAGTPKLNEVADPQAMAALRRRLDLTGRYLLVIGPLEPRRNLPRVLAALARLRASPSGSDLQLLLAGRADPRRALVLARQARDLGLEDAVRVAGVLADEDLAVALSGADALVVACHTEGFCIPVVDAQRLGVPVVAVRAGALEEIGGEAAWLVEPAHADAFANAVAAAITLGPQRDARLTRGRELAQRWSWDRSAALLEDVWRQACGGRGLPAGS